jgi:F-type H+-transporting ATPase subunit epsilon
MATTVHVDVVSAEQLLYSGEAEFVVAPGEAGELGIYPRHTPLLARLKPGAVRIQNAGEEELIFVSGGLLEVQPDGITILSDTAVRGHDLDESRATEALRAAQEAMANKTGALDIAQAQAELAQAAAQISAIRKLRKR